MSVMDIVTVVFVLVASVHGEKHLLKTPVWDAGQHLGRNSIVELVTVPVEKCGYVNGKIEKIPLSVAKQILLENAVLGYVTLPNAKKLKTVMGRKVSMFRYRLIWADVRLYVTVKQLIVRSRIISGLASVPRWKEEHLKFVVLVF